MENYINNKHISCKLCNKEIKDPIDMCVIEIKNANEKKEYCRTCFNHMRKIHINSDNFYDIKNIIYNGFEDIEKNSCRTLKIEYYEDAYKRIKKLENYVLNDKIKDYFEELEKININKPKEIKNENNN